MDLRFELNGTSFVWDDAKAKAKAKAKANALKHDGITFDRAAEVFFDPFFRIVDADRNDEARDAVIGYDTLGRMLFVVHIAFEDESIRIVSASKATKQERDQHDS